MDEDSKYITLLGRTIKITECDVDTEFAAKVAQIQQQFEPEPLNAELDQAVGNEAALISLETEATPPTENDVVLSPDPQENSVEPDEESGNKSSSGQEADAPPSNSADEQEVSEAELPQPIDPPVMSQPDVTSKDSGAYLEESSVDLTNKTEIAQDISMEKLSSPMSIANEDDAPNAERLNQALEETLDDPLHLDEGVSVGKRIDLSLYAELEWKGATPKAAQMRKGYQEIVEVTSLGSMRKIRGDNYCGLRSSCFQILSRGLHILKNWNDNVSEIMAIPQKLTQVYKCNWLTQWSFAGRLKVTPKKRLDTLKHCLQCFWDEINGARGIECDNERLERTLAYFNSGKSDEVLLFEAMKLLMLHSAVILYEKISKEEEVPVFAFLLFARDTSETPEQLMLNHLNSAGDGGGLEQVEMCLLGYALNITIRVLRPSHIGQEDFVTHYPDDHLEDWDICNLIAEDDRHYNIIVP